MRIKRYKSHNKQYTINNKQTIINNKHSTSIINNTQYTRNTQ